MPFVQATRALGRVLAEHHARSSNVVDHPVVTHNPASKAKRGDVVALVHQSSASYVNGPNQTRTRVTIGEVTAATRDGQVKEFRDFEGGAPRKIEHAGLQHAQRYILPKERIADKAGLEGHVRSRGFLAGSGNYRPFESIEEAHAAIKPFVRRPGEAGTAEAAKRFGNQESKPFPHKFGDPVSFTHKGRPAKGAVVSVNGSTATVQLAGSNTTIEVPVAKLNREHDRHGRTVWGK